ncbi:MAG: 3-phosphoshikimate 1-carboxyvinyltransferase [Spirochaetota bacterium]
MEQTVVQGKIGGSVRAPASKSSTQRAIASALLCARETGPSILRNPGRSADCLAALEVARALGAEVEDSGDTLSILGADTLPSQDSREGTRRELHCGESGLALRMFSPIATIFPGESILLGSGSLERRPVAMLEAPLRELGAYIETRAGLPPVRVHGPLLGGAALVDGSESSQFLTGLLLALPRALNDTVLDVPALASGGYVDLTITTMEAFGVRVAEKSLPHGGRRFGVRSGQSYHACDFDVEGDWSGAAFLLVAGVIAGVPGGLLVSGLQPDSRQPDRAILDALRQCGADISVDGQAVVARLSALVPFDFDATNCPDLFPPLAALAATIDGESLIRGAQRLHAKESDRAATIAAAFKALGAEVSVEGDLMRIRGGSLHGGIIDAAGDHRIAMAAAVAALVAEGKVVIPGADCVAKSWPGFFADLESLRK